MQSIRSGFDVVSPTFDEKPRIFNANIYCVKNRKQHGDMLVILAPISFQIENIIGSDKC